MLITLKRWDEIRQHFTQDEKDVLNHHIDGQTICPRGMTINIEACGEVGNKLRALYKGEPYVSPRLP